MQLVLCSSQPDSELQVPVLGDTCFAMTNATIANIGACGTFRPPQDVMTRFLNAIAAGIFVMRFKYFFKTFEVQLITPFTPFMPCHMLKLSAAAVWRVPLRSNEHAPVPW